MEPGSTARSSSSFPGPATATGEDLLELHCHGGRAVVAAVLAALARIAGMRHAEPGEFTRRALTNGRIDLAQAEGLADLLEAESEEARVAALAASEGAVGQRLTGWFDTLLSIRASYEATIDYAGRRRRIGRRGDCARVCRTPDAPGSGH